VAIGGGGIVVFIGGIGQLVHCNGVASGGVTGSVGGEVAVKQWWLLVLVALGW